VQLAVNYSPQAAELLRAGRIEFDLFKSPPWPELTEPAGERKPNHIHSEISSDTLEPDPVKAAALEPWLGHEGTRHMNTHLVVLGGPGPDDESEDALQAAAEFGIAHVRALQAMTSAPVIMENTVPSAIAGGNRRAGVHPEVFRRILAETGCGLLLDTAHARLTAIGLGLDVRTYLEALPIEDVRELHVTGVQEVNGNPRDSMPMTDEDWTLAEWVVGDLLPRRGARPWLCALEYGGVGPKFDWRSDPAVLAADLPRLRRLLAG
jgi:hypothetical protein